MATTTPSTSSRPDTYYDDSLSDSNSDLERGHSAPAPATPSASTKSPKVFESPLPKSSSKSTTPTEPLVKPSTKRVDKSRGQYVPVPLPNAPPSSSSEFSDFSDPERQYPTSERRQRVEAGRASRARHGEETASEEEQEAEKAGRPAQTPAERRKRLKWVLIAGGISVVVVIAIIVTILLLHSGENSSDKSPSQTLDSTAETDHSANSTSTSNSTASSDTTLSRALPSSSSRFAIGDIETSTASPTLTHDSGSKSLTGDLEEIDTIDVTSQNGAFDTMDDETLSTKTITSGGAEKTDLADLGDQTQNTVDLSFPTSRATLVDSSQPSRVEYPSTAVQLTDNDWSHTHIYPDDLDLAPTTTGPARPIPTQFGSHGSPAEATSSTAGDTLDDDVEVDITRPDLDLEEEGSNTLAPKPVETQDSRNQFFPPPSPTWTWMAPATDGAATAPKNTDKRPLPTEYLRPLPVPQATNDDATANNVGTGGNFAQPFRPGSAPESAPTLAPKPEDEGKNATSTKWVGKATWFDPADAPSGCQLEYRETDFAVALSQEIYGTAGSVSIFCGAKVHVWNERTNQTRTATVVGACTDCEGPTDINLSQSLFSELDDPKIGVLEVQWWFEDPLVERQTTADLSKYESTAKHGDEPERYETTAIFWKENGWRGSCGKVVEDDTMALGLPLNLWSDPSKPSKYCGKVFTVKNVATGSTIEVEVVEASNRTDYTTFTKHAFEQLGGIADQGELAVEFWLSN